MKTSLLTTVGAIALTSLAITLTPSTLNAKGSSLDHGDRNKGKGQNNGHHSSGQGGRTCSSLPHGCHQTKYHGESCWFGGGHYYRCNPLGGYVIIDAPVEVETEVVTTPVIETTYEEEDAVTVSVLPSDCEIVYVGGERCWFHDGCYYRRSGHGYCKWHGKGDSHGKTCKTGHDSHNSGRTCSKGHNSSGHTTSHNTSHNSGHNSGHSSHNSGKGRK